MGETILMERWCEYKIKTNIIRNPKKFKKYNVNLNYMWDYVKNSRISEYFLMKLFILQM